MPKSNKTPWHIRRTIKELLDVFPVGYAGLRRWRDEGMPGGEGKWDLSKIIAWREQRIEERGRSGKATTNESKAELEKRLIAEKIRKEKMANDLAAGECVRSDGMRRVIVAWAVKLRSRIMAIPADVVLLVPGELKPAVMRTVEDSVRVALKEAYEARFTDEQVQVLIIAEAKRLTADDSDGHGNSDRE